MWGKRTPTEDVVHYYEDSPPGFWDYYTDHPDGSRTYVIEPYADKPEGFRLHFPKIAMQEIEARKNGTWGGGSGNPLDDLVDLAAGMVGFWWLIVGVLFVFFFIAEVFFGA